MKPILALSILTIAPLSFAATSTKLIKSSESPNKALALYVVETPQHQISEIHIKSTQDDSVDKVIPISDKVRSWSFRKVKINTLWNKDSTAIAFGIQLNKDGEIYGSMKSKTGDYVVADFTPQAKASHIGGLGTAPESEYSHFIFYPDSWPGQSEEVLVRHGRLLFIRSHIWNKKGQRYSPRTIFTLTHDGLVGTN
jgi:hypothetical protein